MLLFDGRDGARHFKNLSALRKVVKQNPAFYQREPAYTFRLSHSNREFRTAIRADRRFRDPDPVESVAVVMPKSFKLSVVPRKHIDLPGDNRSKGLNLVPHRPGDGDGLRAELACLAFPTTVAKAIGSSDTSKTDVGACADMASAFADEDPPHDV